MSSLFIVYNPDGTPAAGPFLTRDAAENFAGITESADHRLTVRTFHLAYCRGENCGCTEQGGGA